MPLSTEELSAYIKQKGINDLKIAVDNLIQIYKDNWDHIIQAELSEQFASDTYNNLYPLITREMNLLKKIVNETSLAYKNPPKRTAVIGQDENGEVKISDNYEKAVDDSSINAFMKTVDKMTQLTNQVLVRPVYRNDKLDFDMYLFNNVEIFTDPEDWKQIIAVKYFIDLELPTIGENVHDNLTVDNVYGSQYGVSIDESQSAEYSMMVLWTLEDKDPETGKYTSCRIRKYRPGEDGEHVLLSNEESIYFRPDGSAVIPFTIFNRQYPVDGLIDYSSGNDLFDANLNLALNYVHLNHLIKYQAYKQIYMKVSSAEALPKEFLLDPTKILAIIDENGSGEIGVLDVQSAIDRIWDIIKERISMTLATRGIPPTAISFAGGAESGVKIRLDKQALMEAREDTIELYREYEHELFDLCRIVWNTHRPSEQIEWDAEFQIDFAEIRFPESREEQARADALDIQNNVITPVDSIMRKNPDLSRDEAERIFSANKQLNQSGIPGVNLRPVIGGANGEGR